MGPAKRGWVRSRHIRITRQRDMTDRGNGAAMILKQRDARQTRLVGHTGVTDRHRKTFGQHGRASAKSSDSRFSKRSLPTGGHWKMGHGPRQANCHLCTEQKSHASPLPKRCWQQEFFCTGRGVLVHPLNRVFGRGLYEDNRDKRMTDATSEGR
jgi:hypothetical protein